MKDGGSPISHFICGRVGAVLLAASAAVFAAGPVAAQGVQSEQLPAVKGAGAGAPQGGTKAQKTPQGGGGDSGGLRERVEQLEAQLVDLQVVIGTLESLARTGGAVSSPARSEAGGGAVSAGDRGRLDSMETQIRALTAQVEQLAAEVRAGGQKRSDAGGGGWNASDAPQTSRFGSTTVTSDHGDPDLGAGAGAGAASNFPPSGGSRFPEAPPNAGAQTNAPSTYGSESLPSVGGGEFAAVEPGTGASPKQVYETAYGHLLQQDYGAAQAGFRDFLKNYPQDPMAPNALYWLGEAHYVQRNFADAAEAFDLVLNAYGTSSKAPDAQLKRGMALAQLGKRQDACTALRGVGSKFPSAPAQVKQKADSERQRLGCP